MKVGVVFAGGFSSRMGTDKALVEVSGRPMIEWVADALSAVCDSVVVAGREGHLAGYRCIPDAWPGVHVTCRCRSNGTTVPGPTASRLSVSTLTKG